MTIVDTSGRVATAPGALALGVLLLTGGTLALYYRGRNTAAIDDTIERTHAEEVDHRRALELARAQQPVTTEKIVERQVLVTRCRFCKKLTPVDLGACEVCGAKS
jgi:hypothetical protein